MPYRHRLAAIALGLVLAVLPLGVLAQVDEDAGQRGTENQQAPTDDPPWAIPVEIIEDQASADARQRREQDSDQREIDDLLAQQGMNEGTRRMADQSEIQTWLIAVGTGLLFITLVLTVQANKAAVAAARAADETARIMRNAERPYLMPSNVRVEGFDDAAWEVDDKEEAGRPHLLKFYFDIANIGKGHGFIKTINTASDVCHNVEGIKNVPGGPDEWPGRAVVEASGSVPEPLPFCLYGMEESQRKSVLANDDKTMFLFGSILYFDMFGIVRRTGFLFEFYPPKPGSGEKGAFVPSGPNSYWFDREEKE